MQANTQLESVYTAHEVAAKLGFSVAHIYNLVKSGDIKTEKRRARPGSRRTVIVVTQAELDRLASQSLHPVGV